MKLSSNFKIAENKSFKKEILKPELADIYKKLKNFVYPQLRLNPFFGPNIKKLKGEFEGFYRFRVGNYRLFYKVDEEKVIVFIIKLKHRQESY